jgi:cytochrome d ubiquinol oxidase subunit I
MIMTPSGFGAVLFGWFTAEIGRQPYVVYGHLRTADAVSPITAGAVTASLLIFIVVYAFVFGFGSYYLAKLLRRGPDPVEDIRGDDLGKKPKRPFSVPDEAIEGRPGHTALPAR